MKQYMESNEIRRAFLDFFRSKEHTIVPSAPMVVKNDPTLMFTCLLYTSPSPRDA